jgi:hypothetical protein
MMRVVPMTAAFVRDFPNWEQQAPTITELRAKLTALGVDIWHYVARDNEPTVGWMFGGAGRASGNWLWEQCYDDRGRMLKHWKHRR